MNLLGCEYMNCITIRFSRAEVHITILKYWYNVPFMAEPSYSPYKPTHSVYINNLLSFRAALIVVLLTAEWTVSLPHNHQTFCSVQASSVPC
jgi:hypothetical protein